MSENKEPNLNPNDLPNEFSELQIHPISEGKDNSPGENESTAEVLKEMAVPQTLLFYNQMLAQNNNFLSNNQRAKILTIGYLTRLKGCEVHFDEVEFVNSSREFAFFSMNNHKEIAASFKPADNGDVHIVLYPANLSCAPQLIFKNGHVPLILTAPIILKLMRQLCDAFNSLLVISN